MTCHCNTCGRFTHWPQRKCQSCAGIVADVIDQGRSIFSIDDRHEMIMANWWMEHIANISLARELNFWTEP